MEQQEALLALTASIQKQLLTAFEEWNENMQASGQSPAVEARDDDRTFERGVDLQRFKMDPELRAAVASYFAQDYVRRYELDAPEQVFVELSPSRTLVVRFR